MLELRALPAFRGAGCALGAQAKPGLPLLLGAPVGPAVLPALVPAPVLAVLVTAISAVITARLYASPAADSASMAAMALGGKITKK